MKNDVFCGSKINPPPGKLNAKQKVWDFTSYLNNLTRDHILNNDHFFKDKKDFFLHAAYTEYDAENFCRHLDALDLSFSPEFMAFEKAWRKDEHNHYLGFRKLYSVIYNESEEEIAKRIEERPYDFTPIKEYFKDEFSICLIIGYDEILTTMAYSQELKMYDSFKNKSVSGWMRDVTRDESYHFHNVMEVIALNHKERINEIPGMLRNLVSRDLERHEYKSTFVLDHDWYSEDFLNKGAMIILKYFKLL